MRNGKWLIVAIVFLLMTACSANKEPAPSPVILPLDVSFQVEPMLLKVGEVATIQVEVKQGEEFIEDASEVEFEIWKDQEEKHDMVPAENKGKGIYSIMERFHEPGIYNIMYHVTARDLHTMKQMQIVVEGDQQPAPESNTPKQEVGHHQHGQAIHFMTEPEVLANQETTFTAHIQGDDHQPLTGAKVQFEIWQNGDEKHQFVDAAEKEPGTYQAMVTLPSAGEFQVQTHVEKGEIHDHITNSLIVK